MFNILNCPWWISWRWSELWRSRNIPCFKFKLPMLLLLGMALIELFNETTKSWKGRVTYYSNDKWTRRDLTFRTPCQFMLTDYIIRVTLLRHYIYNQSGTTFLSPSLSSKRPGRRPRVGSRTYACILLLLLLLLLLFNRTGKMQSRDKANKKKENNRSSAPKQTSGRLDYFPSPAEGLRAPGPTTGLLTGEDKR